MLGEQYFLMWQNGETFSLMAKVQKFNQQCLIVWPGPCIRDPFTNSRFQFSSSDFRCFVEAFSSLQRSAMISLPSHLFATSCIVLLNDLDSKNADINFSFLKHISAFLLLRSFGNIIHLNTFQADLHKIMTETWSK